MQPETNNPSQKIGIPKITFPRPHMRVLKLVAAVVILAGAIGGGYYWYSHRSPSSGAYSYTYKQLTSYILPGEKSGVGVSLQKPVELQAVGTPPAKATQVGLNHTISKNNQTVTAAQISIASVYAGVELQAGYLKNISDMITDPKNVSHEAVIKPIKDFVTDRIPSGYSVTFSEPKALKTDNIKTNAWYLTFTATAKEAKDKSRLPNITGETFLAAGKSTFYYFTADTLSNNWQSNQKVWNQVINSVKLDQ